MFTTIDKGFPEIGLLSKKTNNDFSYLDWSPLENNSSTQFQDNYSTQQPTPFFLLIKTPIEKQSLDVDIEDAFSQIRKITDMSDSAEYSLSIGGKIQSGNINDFLRRRTADEIIESGLSTGCGDYAIAFYHLMKNKGYTVQFVDSVQMSYRGIITAYAGHTGVLVFDEIQNRWFFVDPTAQAIVSRDWDLNENLYAPNGKNDLQYWIGYRGPLENYPIKTSEDLKNFYQETLDRIPKKVWRRELIGLEFVIDDSFVKEDGDYANPNVTRFVEYPQEALKKIGIKPKQHVQIRITKGGEDYSSRLDYTKETGWILSVGTESMMDSSLLEYVEARVRNILVQK